MDARSSVLRQKNTNIGLTPKEQKERDYLNAFHDHLKQNNKKLDGLTRAYVENEKKMDFLTNQLLQCRRHRDNHHCHVPESMGYGHINDEETLGHMLHEAHGLSTRGRVRSVET